MFLSIIAPYYKCSAYIYACLRTLDDMLSKIDLSETPTEIIVVDDFNDQDEVNILKDTISILKHENRFRIIRPTQNLGLSDARNFGVEHAKGEYIFFLDSDDYVNGHNLKDIIEILRNIKTDIIYFNSHTFETENDWREMAKFSFQPRCVVHTDDNVVGQYLKDCTFYAWRFIVKKQIMEKVKFHSRLYMEDIATTPIILSKSDTIWYEPVSVVNYRIRPNSIMTTWNPKKYMDMLLSPSLTKTDLMLCYNNSLVVQEQLKILGYRFFYWSICDARKANKASVDKKYYGQIKQLYDKNFGKFNLFKEFSQLKKILSTKEIIKWVLLYHSYYLYHRLITANGHLKYRAFRRKTIGIFKSFVKILINILVILFLCINIYQLFFNPLV